MDRRHFLKSNGRSPVASGVIGKRSFAEDRQPHAVPNLLVRTGSASTTTEFAGKRQARE
jgi:hypothetical protein